MTRENLDFSKRSVHLETVYPHPPERVWDALTDPEALRQWLLPSSFRPRLGHRFRFSHKTPNGRRRNVDCQVVELDSPRRLAYTWRTDAEDAPTLVTWTLEPVDGGTRVCLEHIGPEIATSSLMTGAQGERLGVRAYLQKNLDALRGICVSRRDREVTLWAR